MSKKKTKKEVMEEIPKPRIKNEQKKERAGLFQDDDIGHHETDSIFDDDIVEDTELDNPISERPIEEKEEEHRTIESVKTEADIKPSSERAQKIASEIKELRIKLEKKKDEYLYELGVL